MHWLHLRCANWPINLSSDMHDSRQAGAHLSQFAVGENDAHLHAQVTAWEAVLQESEKCQL